MNTANIQYKYIGMLAIATSMVLAGTVLVRSEGAKGGRVDLRATIGYQNDKPRERVDLAKLNLTAGAAAAGYQLEMSKAHVELVEGKTNAVISTGLLQAKTHSVRVVTLWVDLDKTNVLDRLLQFISESRSCPFEDLSIMVLATGPGEVRFALPHRNVNGSLSNNVQRTLWFCRENMATELSSPKPMDLRPLADAIDRSIRESTPKSLP